MCVRWSGRREASGVEPTIEESQVESRGLRGGGRSRLGNNWPSGVRVRTDEARPFGAGALQSPRKYLEQVIVAIKKSDWWEDRNLGG